MVNIKVSKIYCLIPKAPKPISQFQNSRIFCASKNYQREAVNVSGSAVRKHLISETRGMQSII